MLKLKWATDKDGFLVITDGEKYAGFMEESPLEGSLYYSQWEDLSGEKEGGCLDTNSESHVSAFIAISAISRHFLQPRTLHTRS